MIDEIRQRLINGYEYALVPKSATSTPLRMSVFAKDEAQTEFYNLDILFIILGKLLVPVYVIGGNHILIRFGFKKNNEESEFKKHIEGLGLVNIRANTGTYDKEVNEIDWDNLAPNGYGMFSILEMQEIPKAKEDNNG